ncbi:zinc transport protein ZntB-like [Trifolium medium]|uniref:Zinc transport protein ZntB-like n=1 Tax=Trifolium medium TaxID=97028 RepID=A0A392MH62_9FABA|nr:zinc transport protein ZntB-like [Trifolium medium]
MNNDGVAVSIISVPVIAHGEQVYLRVKEKSSSKRWFASEDINSLEELIGRLRRLKENVGFIVNRVTAIQASLDSWQSEQINRKLYYLSFLSIIFLPLSIITGALYTRIVTGWREKRTLGKNWSLNRKSLLRRPLRIDDAARGGYLRI